MDKRKVKVKTVEDAPDEPQASTLARMGLQAITDAEMDDVCDVLTDSLASLADLRAAGPKAIAEIDRLRADVAAKDAEIARLKAANEKRVMSSLAEFEARCPHCHGERVIDLSMTGGHPVACQHCKGTGKATP